MYVMVYYSVFTTIIHSRGAEQSSSTRKKGSRRERENQDGRMGKTGERKVKRNRKLQRETDSGFLDRLFSERVCGAFAAVGATKKKRREDSEIDMPAEVHWIHFRCWCVVWCHQWWCHWVRNMESSHTHSRPLYFFSHFRFSDQKKN